MPIPSNNNLVLASFTAPPNQNGVAMAVGLMAKEMKAKNWKVHIATTEADETCPDDPDTLYRMPRGFANTNNPKDQQAARGLYTWLDQIQPTVIVIHSWVGWPILTLMPYAKRHSIPIFLMGHGFGGHVFRWNPTPPFFGLARWLRTWLFIARMSLWIRQMAGLIVLGKRPHYVRGFDHWLAKSIGYKQIHVIPNAVRPLKPSEFSFREKYNLDGKLVYLCVAGYSATKDQLLVLESFRQTLVKNAVMVFIGSSLNDYAIAVMEHISESDADILFLHSLPRNEVEAAIRECDVAVLGSRSEMQPIFLLEAMSEAKPWICPLVGAVDELEGGIICHRSAKGLSAAMSKMADPEYRATLGAIGRSQWKSEFSTEVVYSHWSQILDNITSNPLK